MKKYVGINMIYCNKVFMNGQSHKKGIQCIGQYPTKITDMESEQSIGFNCIYGENSQNIRPEKMNFDEEFTCVQ